MSVFHTQVALDYMRAVSLNEHQQQQQQQIALTQQANTAQTSAAASATQTTPASAAATADTPNTHDALVPTLSYYKASGHSSVLISGLEEIERARVSVSDRTGAGGGAGAGKQQQSGEEKKGDTNTPNTHALSLRTPDHQHPRRIASYCWGPDGRFFAATERGELLIISRIAPTPPPPAAANTNTQSGVITQQPQLQQQQQQATVQLTITPPVTTHQTAIWAMMVSKHHLIVGSQVCVCVPSVFVRDAHSTHATNTYTQQSGWRGELALAADRQALSDGVFETGRRSHAGLFTR